MFMSNHVAYTTMTYQTATPTLDHVTPCTIVACKSIISVKSEKLLHFNVLCIATSHLSIPKMIYKYFPF